MSDGKGCKCGAYSYADCGCPDVDWSCGECAKLKAELAEAVRLLGEIKLGEGGPYIDREGGSIRSAEYDWFTERDAFLTKHRSV